MYMFLHVPKTAGASLIDVLVQHIKPSKYLYVDAPASMSYLSDGQINECDLICGHFGYALHQRIHTKHQTITFLRDPVDRILSLYYYARNQLAVGNRPLVWAAQSMTLDQFVSSSDPVVRLAVDNGQAWQLFYDNAPYFRSQFAAVSEDEILSGAIGNLKKVAFVGVAEQFENSVRLMEQMFGWGAAEIRLKNVTDARPSVDEVPEDVRKKISDMSSLDVQLYQVARDILASY